MTDSELLELAAKAAGITIKPVEIKNVEFAGDDRFIGYSTDPHEWLRGWFNPLTDDGDALRLAVKLGMTILADPGIDGSIAAQIDPPTSPLTSVWADELAEPDPYAATRRAIVRAAAEIGKEIL